ncbi:S1 family peptidase [Tsukamurella sp. 1534]|uniref:S1 family peptidase n=1 Tax=Tsukamurella sp. 1534 TaxID=1151061 RepID=UPI0002F1F420|nr:S1 family peptidase [Tsukamurella sp. 1534]
MRLSLPRRLGVAATAAGAAASILAVAPASAAPNITIGPGSEIDVVQKETPQGIEVNACTLGVLALTPDGRRVGVTAGHCGKAGQEVAVPVPGQSRTIASVGSIEKSSNPIVTDDGRMTDANQPDWGTVSFKPGVPLVNRLGKVRPTKVGRAVVGDQVCRQGRTTGWQCGKVADVAGNRVLVNLKGDHGDSGGPLVRLSDGAALGITSGGLELSREAGTQSEFFDLGFIFAQAGGLRLAV